MNDVDLSLTSQMRLSSAKGAPLTPLAYKRWRGLGPYYATFPVEFALTMVKEFSQEGGRALDPFCGRGTVPFVAQSTGRGALGVDSNPVAWVFAKAKTAPDPESRNVSDRLCAVSEQSEDSDEEPASEFQERAWDRKVLRFLNSARRNLNWKEDRTDWTLAASTRDICPPTAAGSIATLCEIDTPSLCRASRNMRVAPGGVGK